MNIMSQIAVRPIYMQVKDLISSETLQESLLERERKLAIEAILSQAPIIGMDKALATFGDPLLPTEHKLLAALSNKDVEDLHRLRSKLGDLLSPSGTTVTLRNG
jgi:hypothetical protein